MKRLLFLSSLIALVLIGCSKKMISIEFDSLGGSYVEAIIEEEDALIVEPEIPIKNGYIFEGWYQDETYETAFDFSSMPSEDLLLYAKWHMNKMVYGGSLSDAFSDIVCVNDDEYIAIGYSRSENYNHESVGNGLSDGLIVKFDGLGQVLWDRYFGGSSHDSFEQVVALASGGYIAVGGSMSDDGDITDGNAGWSDGLIVKFDGLGNILWHRTVGRSGSDSLVSVVEDEAGNCIAVGYSYNDGLGWSEGFLVKIDSSGELIWVKYIDSDINLSLSSLVLGDDGFVAMGQTYYYGYNSRNELVAVSDPVVLSIDATGDVLWNYRSYTDDYDTFNDLAKTDDGYIAIGYTHSLDSTNASDIRVLVVKYDSEGLLLWRKDYEFNDVDYFSSIKVRDDGDFIIVGYTDTSQYLNNDVISTERDILVVQFDSSGNETHVETYDAGQAEFASAMVINSKGYYVCAGYSLETEDGVINTASEDRDGLIYVITDFNDRD